MKTIITLSLICLSSVNAKIISPVTHTLKNGLEIIFVSNKMAPVVSVGVLYKVGTADDPSTEVGLSHFLEHMMFKGTRKNPGPVYSEIIKKLGGFSNAHTSYDFTYYVTDVPQNGLQKVLDLEADRMENLNFSNEKDLIPEKKVVQQERLMRMDNSPYAEAMEAHLKAAYWYHPYGVPPIGYPHHIEAYSYNSVMNHYKTWYKPNNAVLVIVGDFDEPQTLKWIHEFFGPLKQGPVPKRDRPREPDHKGVTLTIEQTNDRNANTILSYSYKQPTTLKEGEYEALVVLSQILGGSDTSPIYQDLVVTQKLVLGVGLSGVGRSLDDAYFEMSATLSPEQSLGQSLRKFESILKNWISTFMTEKINESHVENAKGELLKPIAFIKDSRSGIREMFVGLAKGLSLNDIITEDERINKVTLKSVKNVYETYLKRTPDVVLKLYPKTVGMKSEKKVVCQRSAFSCFFHNLYESFFGK